MIGDDGCGTPKYFHECVSQDQLREAIEQGQQVMTNTMTQAITAAIRDLRLHKSIERMDKWISTLTDRVVALETRSQMRTWSRTVPNLSAGMVQ
jgi:hypothetical protein